MLTHLRLHTGLHTPQISNLKPHTLQCNTAPAATHPPKAITTPSSHLSRHTPCRTPRTTHQTTPPRQQLHNRVHQTLPISLRTPPVERSLQTCRRARRAGTIIRLTSNTCYKLRCKSPLIVSRCASAVGRFREASGHWKPALYNWLHESQTKASRIPYCSQASCSLCV